MRKRKNRSVVPVYVMAAAWMIYCCFGPLYRMHHFIILIAISVSVYALFSKLFPGSKKAAADASADAPAGRPRAEPQTTGDPELDAVITEGRLALSEFGRLYASIPDVNVKSRITELIDVTDKIVKDGKDDRSDLPRIRRFFNYYVPTTIKLLNAYDRMSGTGIQGENISGTMTRIEDMLDAIVISYKKQLDALFAQEAIDIETDIKVMDGMMEREGLKDKQF